MDIKCPCCLEPFDVDELHENDHDLSFDQAYKLFRTKGCASVFNTQCYAEQLSDADKDKGFIIGELMDLLGEDADGAAAMLEDLRL